MKDQSLTNGVTYIEVLILPINHLPISFGTSPHSPNPPAQQMAAEQMH